jgi:hypothetical protein
MRPPCRPSRSITTPGGRISGVPLADDFEFVGSVASFDEEDSYRAMAAQAGGGTVAA